MCVTLAIAGILFYMCVPMESKVSGVGTVFSSATFAIGSYVSHVCYRDVTSGGNNSAGYAKNVALSPVIVNCQCTALCVGENIARLSLCSRNENHHEDATFTYVPDALRNSGWTGFVRIVAKK